MKIIGRLLAIFFIFNFQFSIFNSARAFEQRWGRNTLRLTAEGATGSLDAGEFYDFLFRAAAFRETEYANVGAVYSLNRKARDSGYDAKDAFLYAETEWGRIEAGWTESIASKMSLLLPDVGRTRLNNAPFFTPDNFNGITNPVVYGNQYAFRVNLATVPTKPFQFGIGRTVGNPDGFNSSTDFGIRFRQPHGRTKTSLSLGLSYADNLRNFNGDTWTPPAFADARYQGTLGLNLQFGSLIWAATAKATVDDNPIGTRTDGLQLGTGASYEFLAWAASASYIFSDVGVWSGMKDITAHTGILSLRYKVKKHFGLWGSVGAVFYDDMHYGGEDRHYFLAGGIGLTF